MRWSGLGDALKWLTGLVGIVPCAACERRQRWLNKVMPFRLKTHHERMFDAQNKFWGKQQITENDSAFMHKKYRHVVQEFFEVFGTRFHDLKKEGRAAFQIIGIEEDQGVLHCALVPAEHGGKFSISRKARRLLKREISSDIVEKTQFKEVKWYV